MCVARSEELETGGGDGLKRNERYVSAQEEAMYSSVALQRPMRSYTALTHLTSAEWVIIELQSGFITKECTLKTFTRVPALSLINI